MSAQFQKGGEEQDCTQFAVLILYAMILLVVMKWVIILQ